MAEEPSPFDDAEPEQAAQAAQAAPPEPETVLSWAIRMNPDEDWNACCVCGGSGEDLTGARRGLIRGLVLLGDGTLARSAWCMSLACMDERYQSTYLPESLVK